MPRSKKPRRCNCPLRGQTEMIFKPAGIPLLSLTMTRLDHDELEAMYLCDSAGMTQQEAGGQMGVSRGTVQRLLMSGRQKLISALVSGKAVSIETGTGEEE